MPFDVKKEHVLVGLGVGALIGMGAAAIRLLRVASDLQEQIQQRSLGSEQVDMDGVRMRMMVYDAFHNLVKAGEVVRVKDIKQLHESMGAPLSKEEAARAWEVLGVDRNDENAPVQFAQFMAWWEEWDKTRHEGDRRGHSQLYTKGFKLSRGLSADEAVKVSTDFDLSRLTRRSRGKKGTAEWRMDFYLENPKSHMLTHISPWHDIPLRAKDGYFHAVIEIPKWTRDKFEIAVNEKLNPIKQDTKKGQLRKYDFYQMFNYGALPQTWEDPNHTPDDTGYIGDNDPIDCVELGMKQAEVGQVMVVKVLGVLAMIDDGETDWKLLVINKDDVLASKLNDVQDVKDKMPGAIEGIVNWFKEYKSKNFTEPLNEFGFNGECQNREYALKTIEECNEQYKPLSVKYCDSGESKVPDTHADVK